MTHLAESYQIDTVVFSPGSRNAPVVVGFTSNPKFKCISIPDERAAAFFALGVIQATKKPVMVCCTSGSAAVNYYPAVVEAFYQQLPLVVVTADRPMEWIDQADGQTIRQNGVFDNHVLTSVNLQKDGPEGHLEYNQRLLNEAFQKAVFGPVHINIPFEEPLYQTTDQDVAVKLQKLLPIQSTLAESAWEELMYQWEEAERKLILIGQMPFDQEINALVDSIADDPSVVVLCESTSNIRSSKVFPCIDRLVSTLNEEQIKLFNPDLLITFGGAIVSKKIKASLREMTNLKHWHIQETLPHPNTYGVLSMSLPITAKTFLEVADCWPKKFDGWQKVVRAFDIQRDERHQAYCATLPWSDMKAYAEVLDKVPTHYAMHIGNSAAIRYVQLFKEARAIEQFCNRGTSGIDGSTSTAAGMAWATNQPVLVITGDVSFFYDSNAFFNNYINPKLRVIIINNSGGGIFRIIPGPKTSPASPEFFESHHKFKAAGIAESFGLEYALADNAASLHAEMKTFFEPSEKAKILEVITPREYNEEQLHNYFKYLKNG